jgi:transketolase
MSISSAAHVDIQDGQLTAIRRQFGPTFQKIAEQDDRLVAVTADLGGSVGLTGFGETHPSRYFNCGVAEQNMIGISVGLAMGGFVPFAATFGSFLGRAMDHVRQSIGHNHVKVNIVGSHGGVSNGKDGPSAHAVEDIAMFRAVPPMKVVVVADANQLAPAIEQAVEDPDPVYLRLYREPTPVFYDESPTFSLGKANVLREGSDVSVVACGPHVGFCLRWAEAWSDSVSVEIIDSHTVKPLDVDTIVGSAHKTGCVVTVEDHYVHGGLGSAVAEALAAHGPRPLEQVALRDYAESGPYYELLDAVGLGEATVRVAIERALERAG